ncbi:MAG: hypothetical protein J6J21_05690 [Clostridia bacterium]|nr:hypothetical protein [Clostridia bacterium]
MIFLYVLLGLIALLLLLLCFDIYICIEYRDGLKLTTRFLGIPIDLSKIIAGSQGGDDEKGEEEKPDEKKEKKPEDKVQKIRDLYSFVCAVLRAVKAAATELKKHLKIRVKRLKITVASEDAATTALRYGTLGSLLSSVFAICEKTCNFRANSREIVLLCDYDGTKIQADFRFVLLIKPLFILTTAAKARLAFLQELNETAPAAPSKKDAQAKQKGTKK